MKLEIDINRIEALTRRHEDSDNRYRRMLDKCGLTIEEIDAIVHRHYRAVSRQIECLECANCCKVFSPLLRDENIDRIARRLKMRREDFIVKYLVKHENGESHFFKITPCPLLAGNTCTVYSDRPDVCRSYPNLHKTGFVFRLQQAFINCSICPIVYNVYERVRREVCERL